MNFSTAGAAVAILLSAQGAAASSLLRVTSAVDDARRVTLTGSHPAFAAGDQGPLPKSTQISGATLVLGRTAAQDAELASLILAQHDAASPLFHQWLTPSSFAERFGVAESDVAAASSWLNSHGFTVDSVSLARDRIRFSGTAAQIQAAFGTELHVYSAGFAPSTDATIPEALGGLVSGLANLSSFRPKSHLKPAFTSGQSGNHFLSPLDLATIYDISPVYAAGFDGSGQTIVVIGQSSVLLSDIQHFLTNAGVRVRDPNVLLVPGSGTATAVSGDQAESDLDLEYTSAIAPGAVIDFVFTGNNKNFNAFDSLQFAVEQNLAPIISVSYGTCETAAGSAGYTQLNAIFQQAASQGQSIIAASGDSGSTDCAGSGLSAAQQQALAVDLPASSQYVTGLGGTEFGAANAASATFWSSNGSADVVNSAKSYIPEQVWNDDTAGGLSSGGGGVSAFTDRPSFQTGVAGIPAGTKRLVPDVSLSSSGVNAPYLYCSSDTTQTGVTGSCSHGFRDANSNFLTTGGGTSFAAPVFAGLVALINQRFSPDGQGVVASTLYSIAANTPAAFHDVTTGTNACTAGTCSAAGAGSYAATAGYDQATGLGSVDFNQLFTAWPSTGTPLTAAKVTLSAATPTPGLNAGDDISISVAAFSSTGAVPTGTVVVAVDGTSHSLPLVAGAATYTFSSAVAAAHTLTATYSGDAAYARASAILSLTVPTGPAFSVAATSLTVAVGARGQSTVTVTPSNGYAGTVAWNVSSTPALSQGCFSLPGTAVSGTTAATLTIDAGSACGAAASHLPRRPPFALLGFAFAGLLGLGSRRRKWLGALLLVASTFTACGGTSTSTTTAHDLPGTYLVSITGTDTVTATITASTTLTLTIQ